MIIFIYLIYYKWINFFLTHYFILIDFLIAWLKIILCCEENNCTELFLFYIARDRFCTAETAKKNEKLIAPVFLFRQKYETSWRYVYQIIYTFSGLLLLGCCILEICPRMRLLGLYPVYLLRRMLPPHALSFDIKKFRSSWKVFISSISRKMYEPMMYQSFIYKNRLL